MFSAGAAVSAGESGSYFERDVASILTERCAARHNPEERSGGLDVTSRETLFEGGDIDHTKLTYFHNGIERRLTDVHSSRDRRDSELKRNILSVLEGPRNEARVVRLHWELKPQPDGRGLRPHDDGLRGRMSRRCCAQASRLGTPPAEVCASRRVRLGVRRD